ncbi:hypothetical protein [Roseibium sp.]|uniref:hypothetical protein n=1 Tax=Roseibium sp. TaxID=1936156 RepID=UPI003A97D814
MIRFSFPPFRSLGFLGLVWLGGCALGPESSLIDAFEAPQAADAAVSSDGAAPPGGGLGAADEAGALSSENIASSRDPGIMDEQQRLKTLAYMQELAKSRQSGIVLRQQTSVSALEELRLGHGQAALDEIENTSSSEN